MLRSLCCVLLPVAAMPWIVPRRLPVVASSARMAVMASSVRRPVTDGRKTLQLISESYKRQDVDGALAVYRAACEERVGMPVHAYNTMMNLFATAGRVGECEAVLSDMRSRGVEPHEATFSALAQARAAGGDLEGAIALIGEIRARGLVPRLRTFKPVLSACCERGRVDLALHVWHEMTCESGLEPAEDQFVEVLGALGAAGELWSPARRQVLESILALMAEAVMQLSTEALDSMTRVFATSAASQRCSAARVQIDAKGNGGCPISGIRLRSVGLSAEERIALRAALKRVIADTGTRPRDELERFAEWLSSRPERITAVIDAPNVAYYTQNHEDGRFSFGQVQIVLDALEAAHERALVLMPTKYLQQKVPNHSKRVPRATLAALGASAIEKQIVTPEEAALVDEWSARGVLYPVPPEVSPSPYPSAPSLRDGASPAARIALV